MTRSEIQWLAIANSVIIAAYGVGLALDPDVSIIWALTVIACAVAQVGAVIRPERPRRGRDERPERAGPGGPPGPADLPS